MLAPSWSILFTLVFCATGAYALVQLVRLAAAPAAEGPGGRLVELNHLIMSALMVAMVWWMPGSLGTGVQVAALALFGLALLRYAGRSDLGPRLRLAMGAHLLGNVAMIWMLVTMPWLMAGHGAAAGSETAGHDHSGHDHSGHAGHTAPAGPAGPGAEPEAVSGVPAWLGGTSWVLVILLVAVAAGWLLLSHRHGREPQPGAAAARVVDGRVAYDWPHRICHATMATAMAAMLVVMR